MVCLTRTCPDITRTSVQMSGDTLPGQTRTPPYKGVQMSGVRTLRGEEFTLVIPSSDRYSRALERPPHRQACVDIQHPACCSIVRGCLSGFAARVRDSFSALRCSRQRRAQRRISGLAGLSGTPLLHISKPTRLRTLRFAPESDWQACKATVKTYGGRYYTRSILFFAAREAANAWRNGSAGKRDCRMLMIGPQNTGNGWGVGGGSVARRIFDLPSRYSAALFQNLGGSVSKNPGRPVLKKLRPWP
jgi:hypothetical protein